MKSMNHNIMYRFSINLFFLFFLGLCSLSFSQNPMEPKTPKSTLLPEKTDFSENVVYKTDEKGNSLHLDIYRSKNTPAENFPVVIYVHGGGWVGGDKIIHADNYIENTILKLVEKKFAVISIDYTLVSKDVHFPAPVNDTKDAVRWVRKNAGTYHFDTNNIGLFGASAGSHLSMLAAYTQDNEFVGAPELSGYSAKVNYVVNNFGPADLNKLLLTRIGRFPASVVGLFSKEIVTLRENLIRGISGYEIKSDKRKVVDYFKTISPITYADHAVPTLILQGNKDKIVPLKQSKQLQKALQKANIKSSLTIVEEGNHCFRTTDKDDLNRLADEMVDFIVAQKIN